MRTSALFLLASIIIAGLTAAAVYSALKRRTGAELRSALATTPVVVASHALDTGSRIEPAAIKIVRWPSALVPAGALTSAAMVAGAIVASPLSPGEPLLAAKLFIGQANAGVLPLMIPPAMRAMSVAVDEVGDIAGFTLPHTRVDVLVALETPAHAPAGPGAAEPRAKIVLQDVQVLAVAQTLDTHDRPQVEKVVTLLVSPQQAERLALASHEGPLRMALRGYGDNAVVDTPGSDLEQVMGTEWAPPPAIHQVRQPRTDRPSNIERIEVLRDGHSRQTLLFAGQHRIEPSNPPPRVAREAEPGTGPAPGIDHHNQTPAIPALPPAQVAPAGFVNEQ